MSRAIDKIVNAIIGQPSTSNLTGTRRGSVLKRLRTPGKPGKNRRKSPMDADPIAGRYYDPLLGWTHRSGVGHVEPPLGSLARQRLTEAR